MRVATGQLDDELILQALYLLRHWHERTRVDVQRHCRDISEAKLATRASSKAVDLALVGENHSVHVTTGGMDQLVLAEGINEARDRLIWIAILVGWECLSVRVA